MRDGIFRGKRTDGGGWTYGYYAPLQREGGRKLHCIADTVSRVFDEVIPETIGAYTGITDKNGEKIYEGDILKGAWNTVLAVYWDKCRLQYRAKVNGIDREIDYYGNPERLEIVGNIHDNPELIQRNKA